MSTESFAMAAGQAHLDQAEALLHALRGGEVDAVVSVTEVLLLHRVQQAEGALHTSEAHFRAMIDALPVAIYTTDAEGRLTHFNPAAVAFSGRVPELGTDQWCVSWKLYYPDGTPMLHEDCPMAIALMEGRTVRGVEAIAERPDGTRLWFTPYPTPLRDSAGRIVGGINMLQDITERKQAEQARAQLAAIVASSDDAIISKDLNSIITSWNRGAERLFGYTALEAIGQPVTMLMPPGRLDDEPRILERIRRGERIDHYETVRRRKDGTLLDISLSVSPVTDAHGTIVGAAKIARDITERTRAEAALRELTVTLDQRVQERTALLALIQDVTRAANEAARSAEALQYAVDRLCAYTGWPIGHVYLAVAPGADRWAPTAIWHLDDPGRFTAFQQATHALELTAGEGLVGRVGARGQPEWRCEVATDPTFLRRQAAHEAGLRTGVAWPLLVGQDVAGVLECYTPEPLAPNPVLLEAMTQIGTQLGRAIERERAAAQAQRQQEALLQREKLAAMSTMLASVAHELNNPLAIILMQADLLREDASSGPLAETAAELTKAAARCERLVRTFLTLARQHAPERTAVDLNALLTDTIEILTPVLRVDDIAVSLHLARDIPRLWADPHQLQQVLVNLLTNAQQALREVAVPRQVTLTTQEDPARAVVTLEVTDNGPGIPPALQARLFEPFFTTKPEGVGTGLGLPLCRGILESHGGAISLRSAPGVGTTFRVELPVGVEADRPAARPSPDVAVSPVPGAAILLVDDEAGIAKAVPRLLQREGHTVDTAANGRLALAKLQERTYDLILCDLRMPELDGPGLYRALEQHAPALCRRFIFLTGDTLNPEIQHFLEHSGVPRLTKPFTAAEVRHAVAQALRAV